MRDDMFRTRVLRYWRQHGRHDLPWRPPSLKLRKDVLDPYAVLVSELMLQQTQVSRVIGKFRAFRRAFPSFRALANAPVAEVLRQWQGLGYNRRALMLHRCAQEVVRNHNGRLPRDHIALCALPGIGHYTAGAILAFAFNTPVPIIETNVRRVILHHYFPGRRNVPDSRIIAVVERTLDRKNPRRWYGALMDYGASLAESLPKRANPNRRSKHYTRQSRFEGSTRQLRGKVLALSLACQPFPVELRRDPRLSDVLRQLRHEGFLRAHR